MKGELVQMIVSGLVAKAAVKEEVMTLKEVQKVLREKGYAVEILRYDLEVPEEEV